MKNLLFVLFGMMLYSASISQIVYFDLVPDRNLYNQGICDIDLNNDGLPDFILNSEDQGGTNIVRVTRNDLYGLTNEILVTQQDTFYLAQCLNLNDPIDATNSVWYNPTGNNWGILKVKGAVNLGFWQGQMDKYLALRIDVSGTKYYGWVRISIYTDGGIENTLIKDWACELSPNKKILAGQMSSSYEEKLTLESQLTVYRYGSMIYVNFPENADLHGRIEIYNIIGELVNSTDKVRSVNFFDLSDQPAGLFIIRCNVNGNEIYQKFIYR